MKKKFLVLLSALALSLGLCGCGGNAKTIKVGASSTPHALILEQAKPYIESKGYKLDITVFNDYVLPNHALYNKEIDANYFQHEPYLNEFNTANNTDLVSVFKVHFEPLGIYSGKKSSIEAYKQGDKVIVPSDKSNYDRAVSLLNDKGLTNPNLIMVESQNIPLMLSDCDYACINGNYALSSGVLNRCLVTESKESNIANQMANVIAVKNENKESDKTKVLVDALCQTNIKDYITESFGDSVIYIGGKK